MDPIVLYEIAALALGAVGGYLVAGKLSAAALQDAKQLIEDGAVLAAGVAAVMDEIQAGNVSPADLQAVVKQAKAVLQDLETIFELFKKDPAAAVGAMEAQKVKVEQLVQRVKFPLAPPYEGPA
jgi:hypothetical protein